MSNPDLDIDIDMLVSDRIKFNEFVHTPLNEALKILKQRQQDLNLSKVVDNYLNVEMPNLLKDEQRAVLFRHVFTPNGEIKHFIQVCEDSKIRPLFFEYRSDIFTPINPLKRSLGKLRFKSILGNDIYTNLAPKTIIDFDHSDGKKICEIKTSWGDSLVDFHHDLFGKACPGYEDCIFDATEWFHSTGRKAKDYYNSYVCLFVRNAILFENFNLTNSELQFTKEVFLPSFLDVYRKTGHKPLIVELLPSDIEPDAFWRSYTSEILSYIEGKYHDKIIANGA